MSNWDDELDEMIEKYHPAPPCPPGIKFPLLAIFYRKRISVRNNNYLIALPCQQYGDLVGMYRTLRHHGWPIVAMTFTIPKWMENKCHSNRHQYYKLFNWKDLERMIVSTEKLWIPDLEKMFPCFETQIKEKNNQYKLIF